MNNSKHREVVDLFAGPGGWDEGLLSLGITDVLGIEWDADACATAVAAGHERLQADVSELDPVDFPCEGLIASPPCTAFSLAGKGEGRDLLDDLLAAIHAEDWTAMREHDPTVWLPLEVGRWVGALRPRWVACEQVPAALPLWEAYERVLQGWGYSTWSGKLSSERYGVPQTRERAFLIARSDGSAVPPEPSHTAYNPRAEDNGRFDGTHGLFGELVPWVSMADALGWTDGSWTVRNGMNTMKHSRDANDMVPYERPVDAPAPTLDGKVGSAWKIAPEGQHVDPPHRWKQRRDSGPGAERTPRSTDEPSYTIRSNGSGSAPSGVEWVNERPSTTVIGADTIAAPGHRCMSDDCCGRGPRRHMTDAVDATHWGHEAPATTIAGDPRMTGRAHHNHGDQGRAPVDVEDALRDGAPAHLSVRVTVEQAAVLQSFRADYPWQGSKTSKFRQVGNAVPPLLAAAVIGAVTGREIQQSDEGGI